MSGNINPPRCDFPRLRPACDPPLQAGFVFLGSRLQRLSANHFAPSGIPHRGHGAVKHIGEPATIRPLQAGRHESSNALTASIHGGEPDVSGTRPAWEWFMTQSESGLPGTGTVHVRHTS